jgi:hypothetical protein
VVLRPVTVATDNRLSGTDRTSVAQEGMRLLDFAAADAGGRDVRVAAPAS